MRQAEIGSLEQEKLNRVAAIKQRLNDLVLADTSAELYIEKKKEKGECVRERGYNDVPRKEMRRYVKELIRIERELGIKDEHIQELRKKYLSIISRICLC